MSSMYILIALRADICTGCRDYAAEAAMTLAWPGTVHLICEWHFIKNVKEKLKGKLGDAWKASPGCLQNQ